MKGVLKYWRVILALVTVFLAGGLMGYTAGLATAKRKVQQLSVPEGWVGQTMRRLDQELDLTPEQREQVVPLLKNASRDLYSARKQAALSSFQRMRTFYGALEPILTPEQKRKLEQAKERMKYRLREGEPRPPFGPGGPMRPPFPFPPRPPGKGPGEISQPPVPVPAVPPGQSQ